MMRTCSSNVKAENSAVLDFGNLARGVRGFECKFQYLLNSSVVSVARDINRRLAEFTILAQIVLERKRYPRVAVVTLMERQNSPYRFPVRSDMRRKLHYPAAAVR